MSPKAKSELDPATERGTCPECGRPTIPRAGGEWCRWCLGYVTVVPFGTLAGEPVLHRHVIRPR